MRTLSLLIAIACSSVLAAAETPSPEVAAFRALLRLERCEEPAPGHVRFAGDSEDLAGCVEKLATDSISELRITSRGGDALKTLQFVRAWAGRIDLLVVDGVCISSCANYLLPAARRVRVEAGAYVLLHGSINMRDIDRQLPRLRKDIAKQLREQSPQLSDKEVERQAAERVAAFRARMVEFIPVQAEFAAATLQCDDWLDPNLHAGRGLPAGYRALLVTPEMAERCLKTARIESFAAPDAQEKLPAGLDLYRARR
jgi:hypothetical protein